MIYCIDRNRSLDLCGSNSVRDSGLPWADHKWATDLSSRPRSEGYTVTLEHV